MHFRSHTECFLLPWKITEEMSMWSVLFHNLRKYLLYQTYVHTTFLSLRRLTRKFMFYENITMFYCDFTLWGRATLILHHSWTLSVIGRVWKNCDFPAIWVHFPTFMYFFIKISLQMRTFPTNLITILPFFSYHWINTTSIWSYFWLLNWFEMITT